MITLIIGGSGSGKSEYAENYITEISETKNKYYIATMQAYDDEAQQKINRHRKLRSNKNFQTIEQPTNIEDATKSLNNHEANNSTALIECISNLTANEMFLNIEPLDSKTATDKIINGIALLKEEFTHLVIVSNNVFEDGQIYDEATMEYIRAMGEINTKLAFMSDKVVEVVVGIPIIIKEVTK
jgi:adenosylcobinamide kinase/adenosylcobinamide-phosphate guanylyltransferase